MKLLSLATELLGAASWRDQTPSPTGPIPIDIVLDSIAKHLWNEEDTPTFMVVGSYPAAVRADEHGIHIPFNDIDVSVQAANPDDSPWCTGKLRDYVTSTFVENVVPGSDVVVNLREVCSLDDAAKYVPDINSSSVAFLVGPKRATLKGGDAEPEIKEWIEFPEFTKFLASKSLEINDDRGEDLGESVVRLVRKGQELNMEYKLPSDIDQSIHGLYIRPVYKELLDELEEDHKNAIYENYDLVPIHDGKAFMFERKGREPAQPPTLEALLGTGLDENNRRSSSNRRRPSSQNRRPSSNRRRPSSSGGGSSSSHNCKAYEPINGYCCSFGYQAGRYWKRTCAQDCWLSYSKGRCESATGRYIKCATRDSSGSCQSTE